jgi:hypothetical protein
MFIDFLSLNFFLFFYSIRNDFGRGEAKQKITNAKKIFDAFELVT